MKNARVQNPVKLSHTAYLHPGQNLEIDLDPQYRKEVGCDVRVIGQFLNPKVTLDGDMFIVEAVKDVIQYAHLSAHYLGEVLVNKNASVAVYLRDEASPRCGITTVINPSGDMVKCYPFTFLEVIYAGEYDRSLHWIWEQQKGYDIEIEEVAYRKSVVGQVPIGNPQDDLFYAHPRSLFSKGTVLHHFWFRLSSGLLKALEETSEKNAHIGRLIIEGIDEAYRSEDSYLDVQCDLVAKHKDKTLEFLKTDYSVSSKLDDKRSGVKHESKSTALSIVAESQKKKHTSGSQYTYKKHQTVEKPTTYYNTQPDTWKKTIPVEIRLLPTKSLDTKVRTTPHYEHQGYHL